MATKRGIRKPAHGPDETPYTGLLAQLPDVSQEFFDAESVPLKFARLLVALEGAATVAFDALDGGAPEFTPIGEEWRRYVLDAKKQRMKQHLKCLELLFEHYNIEVKRGEWNQPDNPWYRLAMALAGEHVPAFQVKRSLLEQAKRRADKPCKLDAWGSACLFLTEYLKNVSKKRALSATEEKYLKEWTGELKQRNLAESTRRSLRQQMLGAHAAYWAGHANDFQRQFVEQVDPLIADFFIARRTSGGRVKLTIDAARTARRCTVTST